jgi:nucleoside-diphosphate-sugar epimerase
MKVGITGASGFIGSFLCNYLHPKYSVTGLSRKLSIASKAIARDYGSVDQHEQFFLDSDVLIHLANSNRPRDTPRSYALDI